MYYFHPFAHYLINSGLHYLQNTCDLPKCQAGSHENKLNWRQTSIFNDRIHNIIIQKSVCQFSKHIQVIILVCTREVIIVKYVFLNWCIYTCRVMSSTQQAHSIMFIENALMLMPLYYWRVVRSHSKAHIENVLWQCKNRQNKLTIRIIFSNKTIFAIDKLLI